MKFLTLICAAFLLLALTNLPIGYYTFLRIIVTIGAIVVIVPEFKNGLNFWVIVFGIIAILFNPLLPIYLHDKSAWILIDIITAIMFVVNFFTFEKQNKDE